MALTVNCVALLFYRTWDADSRGLLVLQANHRDIAFLPADLGDPVAVFSVVKGIAFFQGGGGWLVVIVLAAAGLGVVIV